MRRGCGRAACIACSRPSVRLPAAGPSPTRLGRPPRGVHRLLKAIGSARDGVTFPLALGLTTMGIAGLLVATVPALQLGAGGATSMALSPVGQAIPEPGAASAAP